MERIPRRLVPPAKLVLGIEALHLQQRRALGPRDGVVGAVDREIAQPVEDHLAPVDLHRLENVLVVAEYQVGPGVDGRVGGLRLVVRDHDRAEVHPPVGRHDHHVGGVLGPAHVGDQGVEVLVVDEGPDLGLASGLLDLDLVIVGVSPQGSAARLAPSGLIARGTGSTSTRGRRSWCRCAR